MKKSPIKGVTLSVLILLTICGVARADVEMFMQIEGVPGDSRFNNQDGWFGVRSFKVEDKGTVLWQGTPSSFKAPEGMSSLPAGSSFEVFLYVESVSLPILRSAHQANKSFPKVQLALLGSVGDKQVSFQITLENAKITNLTTEGDTQKLAWSWGESRVIR